MIKDIKDLQNIKDKTFVDKIKEKKKINAQKKLEIIDGESRWDTFIGWVFTNWLTVSIVAAALIYWGYNRVEDYLEEREIRIEAESKLESVLQRTEEAEKRIEKFRKDLETARRENEKLRSKIEDLSPAEKKKVIVQQIDTLKKKMKISEEKSISEQIKSKIFKVGTSERED